MLKRKFFIFLLLFLELSFQSSSLFSEDFIKIKMTDWNLLKTELKKLEESNNQKQKLLIESKEIQLQTMSELENLKNLNQQMMTQLEISKNSLEKSNQKIIYSKIKIGTICFSCGLLAGSVIYLVKK